MPTLEWMGKDKVINHHQDVSYRVIKHKYGFNADDDTCTEIDSENKIIHGDNLEALKSLLPQYEGKVKCIYIDQNLLGLDTNDTLQSSVKQLNKHRISRTFGGCMATNGGFFYL